MSRMVGYDLGMHQAGVIVDVLLLLLMLVIACRAGGRRSDRRRVLNMRAIEVNRPYLDDRCKRQRTNQN